MRGWSVTVPFRSCVKCQMYLLLVYMAMTQPCQLNEGWKNPQTVVFGELVSLSRPARRPVLHYNNVCKHYLKADMTSTQQPWKPWWEIAESGDRKSQLVHKGETRREKNSGKRGDSDSEGRWWQVYLQALLLPAVTCLKRLYIHVACIGLYIGTSGAVVHNWPIISTVFYCILRQAKTTVQQCQMHIILFIILMVDQGSR